VAIHFAKEGADIAIIYLEETKDAARTKNLIEKEGRRCLLIEGDISDRDFCTTAACQTVKRFGRIDILVNNAAEQHTGPDFAHIPPEQLERTFATNVFGMFHLTQAVLPHLKKGAVIVNTTSITAFRGNPSLVDYSSTKGHSRLYARSVDAIGGKGDPGRRGGTRSDLDAPDPGEL
jgi:NAD(P)-dependent dehydrogenase (short-subunit alcohol dehydrogenase family)